MSKLNGRVLMLWPLAVLGIGLVVALALILNHLIIQFDDKASQREAEVVANGMAGRVAEIGHMVVPQTVWDDAVRNLDNRFDRTWATNNILEFLTKTDGFEAIFILDAKDQIVLSSSLTGPPNARDRAVLPDQAALLIAAVRASEAKRVASGQLVRGITLSEPIQSNMIAEVGGMLCILTATLVQPDFGTAKIAGSKAPIVIAAMPLDNAFLKVFARRYLLDGVTIHSGQTRDTDGLTAIPLGNARDGQVATLTWQRRLPGHSLMLSLWPWIAAAFLPFVVVGGMLFRNARRMASGLIASEARTTHLAYHDSLTGLPNRVLFADRLSNALARLRRDGRPLAVFCLDLDRFKEINDSYGHQVGDDLIKEVARRMAAECRESDTVARLSGDEFAIVKVGGSAAHAAAMAERLSMKINRPFEMGSSRLYVGCSIGITMIEDGNTTPAEALRQADIALYRAKETNKGNYSFFETEMDVAIRRRRRLETDLRGALAAGELKLLYQPQVNTRGRISGVEALVRWHHPEHGDVSPSYFIPIAEQCGLIMELGMYTLRQAMSDSARWPRMQVAVNISATQLRDRDFVARLDELVAEFQVDPHMFDLEITEGILLGDDPETQDRLNLLRQRGFGLALDDFGTGYSSLSYLNRYPINKIKIDRSFIANLGVESEADAVVGAIIRLARALNLTVVAEGVETTTQLDHLSAAGCTNVQGYLFSRPVPATEIDRLWENPKTNIARSEPAIRLAG